MLIFLAYANRLRQNVWKKISKGELALEELFEEISSLNQLENKAVSSIIFFQLISVILSETRGKIANCRAKSYSYLGKKN